MFNPITKIYIGEELLKISSWNKESVFPSVVLQFGVQWKVKNAPDLLYNTEEKKPTKLTVCMT